MSNQPKNDKYKWVTSEMFDHALKEVCKDEDLLLVPGVYELVMEHFHNETLEKLDELREAGDV